MGWLTADAAASKHKCMCCQEALQIIKHGTADRSCCCCCQHVAPPAYAPEMEAGATSRTSAPHVAATLRTSSVLPQPGGPDSRAPVGQLMPSSAASRW